MAFNVVLPDVQKESAGKVKVIGMFLESFVYSLDTLRYNEFEYGIEDIGRLYGMLTGNQYFLGRVTDHHRGIKDYRNEMTQFLKQRLLFLVDTAIQRIHIMSKHDQDLIGTLPAPDKKISTPSRQELRLLEFDILNKCEQVEKIDPEDGYKLEESYLHDLNGTLCYLMRQFDLLKQRVRADAHDPIRYRWIDKMHEDHDSVPVIILVAHLIAHVAKSLFKMKSCYTGLSDKERTKLARELVIDEFTVYSNLGTMSIAGILCCYQQPKLFPAAVLNPKGSLGPKEREFLLNTLVLSKLMKRGC